MSLGSEAPADHGRPPLSLTGWAGVQPVPVSTELQELALALQHRYDGRLYLGTSSWHFPGWQGWVWQDGHAQAELSRSGLAAYAQHPLLRTVSLDRAFYRPMEVASYRQLAQQVDDGFRFVVKAPSVVTDAQTRASGTGAPLAENPRFLDPTAALDLALRPALEGLGFRLGVLVFQISPLPARWLRQPAELLQRLAAVLAHLRPHLPAQTLLAVELRDAALLTPALCGVLREHGTRLCLGLHSRLPAIDQQLPAQRAMWPGDLVCRWNLQQGQRYAQARDAWAPFDRMQAPDTATRHALVRVLRGTLTAGHRAFVTINNKAEGCAPASVQALAQALLSA